MCAGQIKSPLLRMEQSKFLCRSGQANRLTPHPRPLPFEGRGSATSDSVRSNVVFRVLSVGILAVLKRGLDTRIPNVSIGDFPAINWIAPSRSHPLGLPLFAPLGRGYIVLL